LFSNPDDRHKYEENLEEEKRYKSPENSEFQAKGVDLMKKLTDYLGK
jgi:Skp family chaperone for outer membrane proteins